ncbi:MAG: hypothetical protein JST47_00995 [Bacteroidetes bacterium]|nr:hypothetical protein [Bacteroidota bacterium]
MTRGDIDNLILHWNFPETGCNPEIIETHISWVVLCGQFAYKIKKPIHYHFLDFSTIKKRKFYCEREIDLNKRFGDDVYLDVLPVKKAGDKFFLSNVEGKIVDYAVRMRKLNRERQMDVLLKDGKVTLNDIEQLAEKIAGFHQRAAIVIEKNLADVGEKFLDLKYEKEFLQESIGQRTAAQVSGAINLSNLFIEKSKQLLALRLKEGFFRDCHGDLHAKNIFLLPSSPVLFDCIEFNDDYRQVDVLNDIAFLCMDLDAYGWGNFAEHFIKHYNIFFPVMRNDEEKLLFVYYKSYRANIRAKVNSLRARTASDSRSKNLFLKETTKYLQLMSSYLKMVEHGL